MMATIANGRLLQDIAFCENDAARLREVITRARTIEGELTARDLGMLDGPSYTDAMNYERDACMKIDDTLSIVELDLGETLSTAEELRLHEELLQLKRPGDVIGKVDDTRYQVAAPWHAIREAEVLMGYVAGAVAEALPDVQARIGCATYPGAAIDRPIPLNAISNRTPVLKASRGR